MKKVLIKNIYGYPSVTPTILKYAETRGYKIMVGSNGLAELTNSNDTMTIVLAGFGMLQSFCIPLVGYVRIPNGVFHKIALPAKLKPNEAEVRVFKFSDSLPESDILHRYFVGKENIEGLPPRFIKSQATHCLNKRVFNMPKPLNR